MPNPMTLEEQRNYDVFWVHKQGHDFRISGGVGEGQVGRLRGLAFRSGEIMFTVAEGRWEHLWVAFSHLEEVCCQAPSPEGSDR